MMILYKYVGVAAGLSNYKEWYIVRQLDDYVLCESTGSNYQQWFKLSNLIQKDKK